nr:hypothetical protein Iba_scaffold9171CG0010 [Ipomoea batatas]
MPSRRTENVDAGCSAPDDASAVDEKRGGVVTLLRHFARREKEKGRRKSPFPPLLHTVAAACLHRRKQRKAAEVLHRPLLRHERRRTQSRCSAGTPPSSCWETSEGKGKETPPLLLVGSLGVDERNKARLHSTELSSPPQPSATAATHVRRRRKHRQPTPLQPIGRGSPAELARRLAPPRNREGHRLLCSAGSRRRGWRCRLRCCRRPTLVEKKRVRNGSSIVDQWMAKPRCACRRSCFAAREESDAGRKAHRLTPQAAIVTDCLSPLERTERRTSPLLPAAT